MAVIGRDPVDIRASLSTLIFPGQNVIRYIEKVCLATGEIDAIGCIDGIMTLGAVFVQYGLYDPRIIEAHDSPFGIVHFLEQNRGTDSALCRRTLATGLVTTDAALRFSGHKVCEASHSLQGSAFVIKYHEIDGNIGRHAKVGRAVRFNGDFAQDLLTCICGAA